MVDLYPQPRGHHSSTGPTIDAGMKTSGRVTQLSTSLVSRVGQAVRYVVGRKVPDEFFGPGIPMAPAAQEAAVGRALDYPVAYNINTKPREGYEIGFHQLRGLADGYDLLRLVIETRKDQIEKISWNIKPRMKPGMTPSERNKREDPRIQTIEDFFVKPDKENHWPTWLRMLLEDLFVIDAPTLYRQRTKGGELYALQQIDGSTIKRLINEQGLTPMAPDAAYQQVLKGLPAVDYSTNEMIYMPRNKRVHRIYGYSPVEQIIMTVNIALRRQVSTLGYYTEGNIPEALISTPLEWGPDQIFDFQNKFDEAMMGQLEARRKLTFVPAGMKYMPTKEPNLKDEFDEWLARICCYAFSVAPTPFIKQMNRATAESSHEAALQEGLAPIQNWVKNLIDGVIIDDFKAGDLEFVWNDDKEQNPTDLMTINTGYVAKGIKTINEARNDIGMDPIPDGDDAIIITATGAVKLEDALAPPEPPPPELTGNSDVNGDEQQGNDPENNGESAQQGKKTPALAGNSAKKPSNGKKKSLSAEK